jgi:ribulose-bisphosphate carboxylase large chain
MTTRAPSHYTAPHSLLDVAGHALSGQRIRLLYRFRCTADKAQDLANLLVHEHTVELPSSVLPKGFLANEIVGRVESITPDANETTLCSLSYAAEIASGGFTTLLTLLMGNGSFLPEVELVDIDLPPTILATVKGPRFGVAGLRQLTGTTHGPLAATALKPLGASSTELATIAHAMAMSGLDIIKEDDGISTQVFAPFHDRVERCSAAIVEANTITGQHTLYFPNITGPMETLAARAMFAKAKGAAGVEILPGPMGLDAIRMIADLEDFNLPIMSHCAWQGALTRQPNPAFSVPMVFGLLPRLAGADLSIMPGFGGRFNISRDACREMALALHRPITGIKPAMPMPGGGITMQTLPDFADVFTTDSAMLMSGALFQQPDLTKACKDYMLAVRNIR